MKRVLVFNFFGGLKHRGIPLYARGIVQCLRKVGADPVELVCPRWLHGLPSPLMNVMFVFFEQCVAPVVRILMRCDFTLYPYNSAGIADALLGRSIIAVHDLMPNSRQARGLGALYVRSSQRVHCRLGRPVCAVSDHTYAFLRRVPRFAACPLHLWHNPFYAFESALTRVAPRAQMPSRDDNRMPRILLCSGTGPNKDFRGAIRLFRETAALSGCRLRIVGFGSDAPLARKYINRLPDVLRRRIVVLDLLKLDDMVAEYLAADVVWVHSTKEGFGRQVVEGRMCAKPVVASSIVAFRALAWMRLRLYNAALFEQRMTEALAEPPGACGSVQPAVYHAQLEQAVRVLLENGR